MLRYLLLSLAALLLAAPAQALTPAEAQAIAIGDTDARITALQQAVLNPDEGKVALLQALADDAVKVAGDKVYIVRDDKAVDAATGEAVTLPDDAEDVINNNRMRGEIDTALAVLKLFSPDSKLRGDAARAMLKEPDAGRLPLIDKALAAEQDERVRGVLTLARAAVLLESADTSQRLAAATPGPRQ